MNKFQTRE